MNTRANFVVPARLRSLRPSDRALIFEWRNSDEVRRFMTRSSPIQWDEHCKWFERTYEGQSDTEFLLFEWNGTPLGIVSFTNTHDGRSHWGFYIAPGKDGGGFGSIMGFMGLDLAFHQLGAIEIIGEVLDFNERSAEFHRKLGFSQVGVEQNSVDGSPRTFLVFRLLAQEWAANRDAVRHRVIKGRAELSWLT